MAKMYIILVDFSILCKKSQEKVKTICLFVNDINELYCYCNNIYLYCHPALRCRIFYNHITD